MPVRKKLKRIYGQRRRFRGEFVRFGTKSGWVGPERTVLLRSITTPEGEILTDHLWFKLTKGFAASDLSEGDIVEFDARVDDYVRGYQGRNSYLPLEMDYHLSRPTNIVKVA